MSLGGLIIAGSHPTCKLISPLSEPALFVATQRKVPESDRAARSITSCPLPCNGQEYEVRTCTDRSAARRGVLSHKAMDLMPSPAEITKVHANSAMCKNCLVFNCFFFFLLLNKYMYSCLSGVVYASASKTFVTSLIPLLTP